MLRPVYVQDFVLALRVEFLQRFSLHESNVQVSAALKTDITRAWYYKRILVLSWRILSRHIRPKEDMTDAVRLIRRFMSGRLLYGAGQVNII